MCVCNCVFFCNVCVFLFSIFASFVTYNSTNLQSFFFHLIFPRDKASLRKTMIGSTILLVFIGFILSCSLSLSLFLSLATCSLIFSLFILETDYFVYCICDFFFYRYWRHCRKTFVMFHAEENNREGRRKEFSSKLEAGN